MIDKRVSWDEYFIQHCDLISTRGTCDRKRVGAVIVKNKRVIASGYNGSLPGAPHCSDLPEFYMCSDCGNKFSVDEIESGDKPNGEHNICCLGRRLVKKFGGHDIEEGSCVRTVHAEINAIAQAARMGISTDGATIYINTFPCYTCFKTIVSSGIKEIVYSGEYRTDDKEYKRKVIDRVLDATKMLKDFTLRKFK